MVTVSDNPDTSAPVDIAEDRQSITDINTTDGGVSDATDIGTPVDTEPMTDVRSDATTPDTGTPDDQPMIDTGSADRLDASTDARDVVDAAVGIDTVDVPAPVDTAPADMTLPPVDAPDSGRDVPTITDDGTITPPRECEDLSFTGTSLTVVGGVYHTPVGSRINMVFHGRPTCPALNEATFTNVPSSTGNSGIDPRDLGSDLSSGVFTLNNVQVVRSNVDNEGVPFTSSMLLICNNGRRIDCSTMGLTRQISVP